MDEASILELFRQDPEAGARALGEHYQYLLWAICARRLNDPEDIRECVYTALGDFCLQWERFDEKRGGLKSYLIAIADRKAMDKYRQNRRWALSRQAAHSVDPVEGFLSSKKLLMCLDRLPKQDQALLYLRYIENMSYRDIARRLRLPYEQVKKRGYRALKKSKKLWEDP